MLILAALTAIQFRVLRVDSWECSGGEAMIKKALPRQIRLSSSPS